MIIMMQIRGVRRADSKRILPTTVWDVRATSRA